jgi:hypothetical protein
MANNGWSSRPEYDYLGHFTNKKVLRDGHNTDPIRKSDAELIVEMEAEKRSLWDRATGKRSPASEAAAKELERRRAAKSTGK